MAKFTSNTLPIKIVCVCVYVCVFVRVKNSHPHTIHTPHPTPPTPSPPYIYTIFSDIILTNVIQMDRGILWTNITGCFFFLCVINMLRHAVLHSMWSVYGYVFHPLPRHSGESASYPKNPLLGSARSRCGI